MIHAASRARVFFGACALAAVTSTAAAGDVTVEVDWGKPTGKTASRLHYGLNAFHSTNPAVFGTPGLENYKKNLAFMRPGIVRIHTWEMIGDSTTSSGGWWIDPTGPNYAWDKAKIKNSFDGTPSYGQTWMVNIPVWPAYLGVPTDGKRFRDWPLKPTEYDAFAAFCAELVRIINVEQKRGVKYFEVLNEREGRYAMDVPAMADIYARAARAMKKVDPTIKVGGPAFTDPWDKTVEPFIKAAIADLDFVSFHTYTQYDLKNLRSTGSLLNSAAGLASGSNRVASLVKKYAAAGQVVELFHNEFNLSVADEKVDDDRMKNIVSALFDALSLGSLASSGATGAMAWNESDGWFGKLESPKSNSELRPAASVYHLYNGFMVGPVVTTKSSLPDVVTPFAVADGPRRAIALVNRDELAAHKVAIAQAGTGFAPTAALKLYQLTACDLRGSAGMASKLLPADGIDLPPLSVTVVVEGGQEAIPAGGVMATTPNACKMQMNAPKDAGAPRDAGVADARASDAAPATGTPDAAPPPQKDDAGAPPTAQVDAAPRPSRPTPDAATDPGPGEPPPIDPTTAGGCGCRLGPGTGGVAGPLGAAAIAALFLFVRRRRR